jgi:hypothetical protein
MSKGKARPESPTSEAPSSAPRQSGKKQLLTAAGIFASAFALYLYTLAPTVTLVDSGELIVAAHTLGVAHPPGFPLYVLLAHAATWLPWGNIATRVHLVSALSAAIASAVMFLLIAEAIKIDSLLSLKDQAARKKSSKAPDKAETRRNPALTLSLAPAAIGALLCACSRTLWAYATIAEVYALNTLLLLLIFWLMMRWRREASEARRRQLAISDKTLLLAAFLFGLALGVHHVTVALTLPALAAFVLAIEGWRFFASKRLLRAGACALAGLCVYAYLPLAASRSPLMNWGDARTLERFWWHISGRQYRVFFDVQLTHITEFVTLALREFGPAWLPLALVLAAAGLGQRFKRDRATFYLLSLLVAADVVYGLGYEIAEDKDAYYLPAFMALTVAVAFGVHWVLGRWQRTQLSLGLPPRRVAFVLLLIPLIALAGNFAYNNRRQYFIASDYVSNIFNSIAPRGLLLTGDWQVYSPLLYLREVEGQRRDVIAIDLKQLRRSWYFDYLGQVYPELMGKSRREVEAYLEDLRRWEHDPELYARDRSLAERINTRFFGMILSFVTNQIKDAPVYVTQEIALDEGGQDRELTRALHHNYQLVPQGLVFRVTSGLSLPEPAAPRIVMRGLADGTLKFADDDVVKQKVLPVYVAMLANNGRYLASKNQYGKAMDLYRQALALEANYAPAQRWLDEALQQQRAPQSP